MCGRFISLYGEEIRTPNELKEYGIPLEVEGDRCFCGFEDYVVEAMAKIGMRWERDRGWGGWVEMDENGISWLKDAYIIEEDPHSPFLFHAKPNPEYPYEKRGHAL